MWLDRTHVNVWRLGEVVLRRHARHGVGLLIRWCLWHEAVPGHVRQAISASEVVRRFEKGATIGAVIRNGSFAAIQMAVCCCCRLVLEVCHQHGGSFKVEHTIAACLYLLQRARVDTDGGLRRSSR